MVCCILLSVLAASVMWLAAAARRGGLPASRNAVSWRPYAKDIGRHRETAPAAFSIAARLRSFKYAADGLRIMVRHEHNTWIHLAATLTVLVVAYLLKIAAADWRWIAAAIACVWFAEAVNTAFEHLCDAASPHPSEAVRIAKDVAAAAVLISALAAILIGAITLMPYLLVHVSASH